MTHSPTIQTRQSPCAWSNDPLKKKEHSRREPAKPAADPDEITRPLPEKTIRIARRMQESDPTAMTSPKEVIANRYLVKRMIGHGGFGAVYLADDLKIGRLVAIKQLYENLATSEEMAERFLQEARIAGQLEHPNIVILYNVEEVAGTTYMVMEYLGGGSLADLMANHPHMDLRAAIQIMLGIMNGLDAAHRILVVHRDIKPQNILFGIGGHPKITDFGIAHIPIQAGGKEILDFAQEQGTLMGTPAYMAPEQICGDPVDTRSDIYSAGAIFYRMLTGENLVPVGTDLSLPEIRDVVTHIRPKPISTIRPNIPESVQKIVERMTAKRAEERFGDSTEVKSALVQTLAKLRKPGDAIEDEIAYPSMLFWNSPATILEDILYLLLLDRSISPAERRELDIRIERLGISRTQAGAIEDKVRLRLKIERSQP
jgi:serine/threonine-protein kinase